MARMLRSSTYKEHEKEWIHRDCFVPRWLKLAHFGDVNGTNEVRAA